MLAPNISRALGKAYHIMCTSTKGLGSNTSYYRPYASFFAGAALTRGKSSRLYYLVQNPVPTRIVRSVDIRIGCSISNKWKEILNVDSDKFLRNFNNFLGAC